MAILIHADGRVGSITDDNIGHEGAEQECGNVQRLRLLAQRTDTYLPAAFTKQDTHTTWVHTHANIKHRIDYVMVPNAWKQKV